jgi:hypothetical protein
MVQQKEAEIAQDLVSLEQSRDVGGIPNILVLCKLTLPGKACQHLKPAYRAQWWRVDHRHRSGQ